MVRPVYKKLGLLALAVVVLAAIPWQPKGPPEVWVEVHDFSPGYGYDEIEPLMAVLEGHHVSRVVVLVIPNRNGTEPIHEDSEFTAYLKDLEDRGVEIGAHGYSHQGFEFRVPRERARELMGLSLEEFHRASIYPEIFYPPRYLVSDEALSVLLDGFDEVFLRNKVVSGNDSLPYHSYEFLPAYTPSFLSPVSQGAYRWLYRHDGAPVFRLSIHLSDIDPDSLEDLDAFLTWVEEN